MPRSTTTTHPLWFDINLYAPDRHKDTKRAQENRDTVYRHINFMVHLLWGVPYHSGDRDRATVHGSVALLAKAMKANLSAPDWPSVFGQVPDHMIPILDAIVREAKRAGSPAVSDLYFGVADKGSYKYEAIIRECRKLRDELRSHGYEICLPFIDAFDTGVPPASMIFQHHSTKLGDLTLMDLYVNPILTRTQRNSIVQLTRGGVFRPRSQTNGLAIEGPRLRTGGQGNYHKCKTGGGGCESVTDPNCYCSTDSSGNCSAMSTC